MAFNNAFEAVFGSSGSRSTASSFIRQLSSSNADFRRFSRTPLGSFATGSLRLLSQNRSSLFDDFFSSSRNSASHIGASNLGNAGIGLVSNLIEDLLDQALTRRKVRTTVAESERSIATQKLWNSSRSEQDALLASMVQRGMGEF